MARLGGHKGAQTVSGLPQSPIRSFEVSGSPNRSPGPLVQRAGRDHPFPIPAGSPWRERDFARRVGHGSPAIPGGKTTGIEERERGSSRGREGEQEFTRIDTGFNFIASLGARSLECTKRWSDQSLHPPFALCRILQLDESSWHSGCDVIKGTNWGANYWITLKHVHE